MTLFNSTTVDNLIIINTSHSPGYTHTQLEDAAREAGQDWRNGSILYNTIYKCLDEGAIVWDTHCANGCNPPIPQEGKDFYHCR